MGALWDLSWGQCSFELLIENSNLKRICVAHPKTVDEREVQQFAGLATKWWDPSGEFRALHVMGPARLSFIRDSLVSHFEKSAAREPVLEGLDVLDVGCGGGLICEPLRRLGARVTGIDPAQENIDAAKAHAKTSDLEISYRAATVEDLAAESATFDAVVCLEVVEHVPDVPAFLQACAELVRPGGQMILSTISRTAKSYGLAIVAAEYVLSWVPRGTHNWNRFVQPEELQAYLQNAGLRPGRSCGLTYDLLRDDWRQTDDLDVNYMMAATKPG